MRVAYDPGDPSFADDRSFTDTPQFPEYGIFWRAVRELLTVHGIEIHTGDIVQRDGGDHARTILISQGWSPQGRRLLSDGAAAGVVMSWESPVVDQSFYHYLPKISSRFEYAFLFPGARTRVRRAQFRPMFPPQVRPPAAPTKPWRERRFLTAVIANKYAEPVSVRDLLASALGRLKSGADPTVYRPSVRRQLLCLRDPVLARDLYLERLRAIIYFARADDFDLYGRGWASNALYGLPADLAAPALAAYRGSVDNKLATLAQYRFGLAFENTRFPGYVTEKLFHCLFAGTIPVYVGAPDIREYVPADVFIDGTAFPSHESLEARLRSVTDDEAGSYQRAAERFLASSAFDAFDHHCQAVRLVAAVRQIAAGLS